MKISIYQIDAFASRLFEGNPAAVCPLAQWLPDGAMQSIAAENNLSETAFFVPEGTGFHIRWFTPASEVDLCGHATLASAYVLFNILGHDQNEVIFRSKSGRLPVIRKKGWLVMDLPLQTPVSCETPEAISAAFGQKPMECLRGEDYIVVLADEGDIQSANPDISRLLELDLRGVIITSRSNHFDFVSRVFAPKYGIPEDPVTGSAYTQLAPYWAAKMEKNRFHAKQLSQRGGELHCEIVGDRVLIYGKAVKYLEGEIVIDL
jgi:PhzF family phenazine biosynthesis protein